MSDHLAGIADLVTPLFAEMGGEEQVNQLYYEWQGREEKDDRKMFRKLRTGTRHIRPALAHRLGMFFGSMDPWWSGMAMLYVAGHFEQIVATAALALEANAQAPVNILRHVMVAAAPFPFDNLPLRTTTRDPSVMTFGRLSLLLNDHDRNGDPETIWEVYSPLLPALFADRNWRMIFLGRMSARKNCLKHRETLAEFDSLFAGWKGAPSPNWSTDTLAVYEVARSRIITVDGKMKRLQEWLGRPHIPDKQDGLPPVKERRGHLLAAERVKFVPLTEAEIREVQRQHANDRTWNHDFEHLEDDPTRE